MKNVFKRVMMLAAAVMMACTMNAQQAGDLAIGGNLNYSLHSDIKQFGIGAKMQYSVTDAIRIEPSFNYFFKKDYFSSWDVNINAHYVFNVAPKWNVYPLVGITLVGAKAHLSDIADDWGDELGDAVGDESETRFGGNVGAGVEYLINDQWSIDFEAKYQIVSDIDRPVISLGVAYKF